MLIVLRLNLGHWPEHAYFTFPNRNSLHVNLIQRQQWGELSRSDEAENRGWGIRKQGSMGISSVGQGTRKAQLKRGVV